MKSNGVSKKYDVKKEVARVFKEIDLVRKYGFRPVDGTILITLPDSILSAELGITVPDGKEKQLTEYIAKKIKDMGLGTKDICPYVVAISKKAKDMNINIGDRVVMGVEPVGPQILIEGKELSVMNLYNVKGVFESISLKNKLHAKLTSTKN